MATFWIAAVTVTATVWVSLSVCVMSDLQLTGSPLPPLYRAEAYVAKGSPLCDANQTLCLLRRINNIQVRPQVKVN